MEVSNGRSVEAVELLTVQLQLERPMETSYGVVSTCPVLLVRVAVADGEGWGECVALEHPSYTSEFHNGAVRVLEDELVPALLRDQPTTPASLKTTLSFVRGHEMAKAALEMALVDLVLSSAGRSLAEHLGVTRSRIAAGANVGLGEASAVVDAVGEAAAAGYRRVKLKISPKADLLLISAVQKAFPTLTLCADANGAYDLDDESHKSALMALDELQLSYLEQPLRPGDLVGHAATFQHA